MAEQQNGDEFQEEIVIEVHYTAKLNEVLIIANDLGLQRLQDILEAVRNAKISGHHYHLDKATNRIDGNVNDLVLMKK
jgi:hypothetical protein